MDEFDLIAILNGANPVRRADVALGIGDDAALLHPPLKHLVLATDTLVSGVHFPPDSHPEDIGYKSLAVNLSDVAAMGATPLWALLSLTLPEAKADWCEAFASGFFALAQRHDVALVGGDTCRGPLSITVSVAGTVDVGVRRAGAQIGDAIVVTGWLGDAAAGLALAHNRLQASTEARQNLSTRLRRPTPRVSAGLALGGLATAMIDVSDGLLADLGHILTASGLGAQLTAEKLPTSRALQIAIPDQAQRWPLQLSGGDDYELLACIPRDRVGELSDLEAACGHPVTLIGEIRADPELEVTGHGQPVEMFTAGFQHF